jgi:hypothetical protein
MISGLENKNGLPKRETILLLSVLVSDFHSILRFELVGAAEPGSFYFLFEAELA